MLVSSVAKASLTAVYRSGFTALALDTGLAKGSAATHFVSLAKPSVSDLHTIPE